jgi:hypothetical protein
MAYDVLANKHGEGSLGRLRLTDDDEICCILFLRLLVFREDIQVLATNGRGMPQRDFGDPLRDV